MTTSSPAVTDLKTVGVLRLFGGREMYSVDILQSGTPRVFEGR